MLRKTLIVAICSVVACPLAAQQVASLPNSQSTAPSAPATYADYVIAPQDTLTVTVFGVPELSQTVDVDNAGYISLPLLGRVAAAGRTTDALSRKIADELNAKYVKNPTVTVTLKDAGSQKVTVDGEVTAPGVYQINPHTTLTEAVALAKGPDQVADIHHVSIVRATAQGKVVSDYDLDDIHDGKTVDPYVRANDEIVVDSSGSRKFVRDFGSAFSLVWLLRP